MGCSCQLFGPRGRAWAQTNVWMPSRGVNGGVNGAQGALVKKLLLTSLGPVKTGLRYEMSVTGLQNAR